jgi:hypothetical protein
MRSSLKHTLKHTVNVGYTSTMFKETYEYPSLNVGVMWGDRTDIRAPHRKTDASLDT